MGPDKISAIKDASFHKNQEITEIFSVLRAFHEISKTYG